MRFATPTQPIESITRNHKMWAVAGFTLGYLIVASLLALYTHNWEFVIYIAVVVLLAAFTIIIRLYSYLSIGLLWALSIWGLIHMAGGMVHVPDTWLIDGTKRVLYSWWIIPRVFKFDNFVHAYGFAVTTVLCWQALRGTLINITPRFGILSLCVLAALGLGALNEIVEFTAVKLVPHTNVGGYDNTLWDLVWNTIGALTAALFIAAKPHIFDGEKGV